MPYFSTAQEWLQQSTLLLQARPTTTRISTKYTLASPLRAKYKSKDAKPAKSSTSAAKSATATDITAPPPLTTRATLTLKTYDPVSGVTLKYNTDKAAEVGRLVSSMAQLGRIMAGLPEMKEDTAMLDVQAEGAGAGAEGGSGVATPLPDAAKAIPPSGGQGGKKKGKKGKK